jgi:hypothetical protein
MKSGKQRRAEIKKSRLERIAKRDGKVNPFVLPIGVVGMVMNNNQYTNSYLNIKIDFPDTWKFRYKATGQCISSWLHSIMINGTQ